MKRAPWYRLPPYFRKLAVALILGTILGAFVTARVIAAALQQHGDVYQFDTDHFHCIEHVNPYQLTCTPKSLGT